MKKSILYFTLVFCAFVLIHSCKKDSSSVQKSNTINVSIKANENYSYDLGAFGYEEGAIIDEQAIHYDSSFIKRDLNTGQETYTYKPSAGYLGNDEVKLKSERGSDGASPNNKIIYTTIEFTITN